MGSPAEHLVAHAFHAGARAPGRAKAAMVSLVIRFFE